MVPFDTRLFLRLICYTLRDARSARAVGRGLFLAVAFPSVAIFGSVGMLLDWLLFPGLRSTKVTTPIIVTGHARSGTTLMVKLLARDRRTDFVMLYEMVLPSIVQKMLVRWLAAIDTEYLGGFFTKRVTAWEDKTFEQVRKMHPMGLTMPEEDAFLLAPTFLHAQVGLFFPYPKEIDELFYFDQRTPRQKRRAMHFYRACIRRHLYLNRNANGSGSAPLIFLSKNPTMVGALVSLREAFPDAKFVVMMRSPYETIPSLLKLMVRSWRGMGFEREAVDEALARLGKQSLYYYQYPFDALGDLPESDCAFVRYEELVDRPAHTIGALYEQLGFPMTRDFEAELKLEETRARKHRHEHIYSLEEFGLTREEIRAALPEAFDRFGWEAPAEPEAPTEDRSEA